MRWSPWEKLRTLAELRVVGDQFEDDLNTLRLGAYATIDLSITYTIALGWQARAAVENVFDTEVETGKSADGVVSIGEPRLFTVGVRWTYGAAP